jgi:hypothetical protein
MTHSQIAALNNTPLNAQLDSLWTTYIGQDGWDFGEEVQQTSDGGFIVAGVSGADVFGNPDILMVKTDEKGDTLWTANVGDPEARNYAMSVQETDDGGFILTGYTNPPGRSTMSDLYIVKTDSQGDTLWTRTVIGSGNEIGTCVRQTDDGGYIITGFTSSTNFILEYDLFLLKTDTDGYTEWVRNFGGPPCDEAGYSVEQTTDGGYIVCGYKRSAPGGGYADIYLIKTDSNGIAEWEETIGGFNEDIGWDALQTSDGGYIVAGQTKSFGASSIEAYLVKVDPLGQVVWEETYGGVGDDVAYSLIITGGVGEDEEYVMAGKTCSFGDGDEDLYLFKVDANSYLIWEWVAGGSDDEAGRSIWETSDGAYVVAGNTGSFAAEVWDVFLMKVASPQGVEVSIEPTGRTTLQHGDVLEFNSTLSNNTNSIIEGDYWLTIVLPNGNNVEIPDAMLSFPGLTSGQIFAGNSLNLSNAAWVYNGAEIGTYKLIGRLGVYPDVIVAEDSFEFDVTVTE